MFDGRSARALQCAVFVFLALAVGCVPGPESAHVEIAEWTIDSETAEGNGTHIEGTARLLIRVDDRPAAFVLSSITLLGVVAEVEAESGEWPVTVSPGETEERTVRFRVDLPYYSPSPPDPSKTLCLVAVPTRLTLSVTLDTSYGEYSATQQEPATEAPQPTVDWGFRDVAIHDGPSADVWRNALVVDDAGVAWFLTDDNNGQTQLWRLAHGAIESFPLPSGSILDLDAALPGGPVLTHFADGSGTVMVERVGASAPWVHALEVPPWANVLTSAQGDRVLLLVAPAEGVTLDGIAKGDMNAASVVFELDVEGGDLQRVASFSEKLDRVVALSGGRAAVTIHAADHTELLFLDAELLETARVPVPYWLAQLTEGSDGSLWFSGPSFDSSGGPTLGHLTASGALDWSSSLGGDASSFAPLPSGGLLAASGGFLIELDESGATVQAESVACGGLQVARDGAGVQLVGAIRGRLGIDGTYRETDFDRTQVISAHRE